MGRRGRWGGGSSSHCQCHPPGQVPLCPGKVHVEAASKTGALPKKGCRSLSHVGGPGVSESTGSLIYRLAGGQVSAGLCPSRCRRGRGGTSGSLLVLQPPWVGPPGHPAVLWAQSWGEGTAGPTPGDHSWGRAGGRWGLLLSPCGGDTGSGGPWGQGEVAGQWLGGWQREPRQAGPSLGAGPGWGHRKSQ